MKSKTKYKLLTTAPLLLSSIAIVLASSRPEFDLPNFVLFQSDKIFHLIAYFFYGLFIQIFIIGNFHFNKKSALIFTLITGSLFAASDEIHQSFVIGRYADIFDFVANFIGIILSLFLFKYVEIFCNKIKNSI